MKVAGVAAATWKSSLRTMIAAGLCVLLVDQPLIATAAVVKRPATATKGQIQGDERVLHALNRLTFGPRPGDVEAVKAMGLQRWFDLQLNPTKIDDSALQARLAMFPAMQMRQEELIRRYPNGQMLKRIIDNHDMLPHDPVEHALYTDLIAYYKDGQAKKAAAPAANNDAAMNNDATTSGDATMADPAAKGKKRPKVNLLGPDGMGGGGKKQAAGGAMTMEAGAMEAGNAALPGDGVDPANPSMKDHEEQFYSGLAAVKIINLPPDERMDRVLAMKPDELIDFRKSLSRDEVVAFREGLNPQQLEILGALQGSARMVGGELLQSRLMRDLYSDRQLEAVMTDFWLNHFNIYVKKNQNEPYLLPEFERDVVRPRALGKFEDLLVATAKSPAMLMYLDNQQSIGPQSRAALNSGRVAQYAKNPQAKQAVKDRGLNENYARELMELHTLGVQCEVSIDHPMSALDKSCGRGYTQQDVTQVALVLTGWTLDRPQEGGQFEFEPRRHQPGTKVVMGKQYIESGESEGAMVLHELATSPATAKFISTKLAVRFVSDTPPPALVDKMSAAFLSSGGDMKAVLRAMFDAPEFWSPEVYRAKVKTPLEFVTSAVRASGADVTNAQPLVQSLEKLGMPLYGMQTPNGYSWTQEHWVNTGDLVNRMNFSLVLAGNNMNGVRTDWTQILGAADSGLMQPVSMSNDDDTAAVAAKEKRLEFALLGQPVSEKTRATVLEQADNMDAQQEAEKNFALRLAGPDHVPPPMTGSGGRRQGIKAQAQQRDSQTAVMAGLLLGSPEFQRR